MKVKVKVAQLCPTHWDPKDSTVYGLLEGRILEWVAVPFSRGSSQSRDETQVSCMQVDSYQLNHKGSPRILEGVASPFSRGSSQPRDQTQISCMQVDSYLLSHNGSPRIL